MFKTLTMEDRAVIKELWDAGAPVIQIAQKLECSRVCIYAELKRGETNEMNPDTQKTVPGAEKAAEPA